MSEYRFNHDKYIKSISKKNLYSEVGRVSKSIGLIFEGHLPSASLGSIVVIESSSHQPVYAEVIGFREKKAVLMPFDETRGVNTNSEIRMVQIEAAIQVGAHLIGRVIDAKGNVLDDGGSFVIDEKKTELKNIYGNIENPMKRACITESLDLGVRALNGLLTCAKGQRLGIMAGSGIGKSTLLGMIARNTKADINVIALIGERGRELKEFIERDLGEEGLRRSIVVVATSEKSPLLRMRGAFVATTIAEYFSHQGLNVLLMMDSLTRFCMAQREIGLSMGEPPASKGYTPSVFATLPKLLERAGTWESRGSITGLYTVLVDGDDLDEPIADSSRAILDGHIVLSRSLANKNHYPPIDISQSISRCMSNVISKEHQKIANEIRELMATYQTHEDLINIGAYVKGTNPKLDQAIAVNDRIRVMLRQNVNESNTIQESVEIMRSILSGAGIRC